ncbi:NACHT, LRR and PYD domains-containing protein 3-like [Triplophysa dalaica]|uniref:NACHT, LRR and PYD domains-containing protein 3-like n=1 Tax=Triplophysa dalaica TaxID=1582913 RepID=UPI0024DFEFFB|nr:NACHT, LRR and PYD domains-containing protein 3-like [Triplophysa dalaica]
MTVRTLGRTMSTLVVKETPLAQPCADGVGSAHRFSKGKKQTEAIRQILPHCDVATSGRRGPGGRLHPSNPRPSVPLTPSLTPPPQAAPRELRPKRRATIFPSSALTGDTGRYRNMQQPQLNIATCHCRSPLHSPLDGASGGKDLSCVVSKRSSSSGLSSVSLKSDRSKHDPPNFSEKTPSVTKRLTSSVLKIDKSNGVGPIFSEKTPLDIKSKRSSSSGLSCVSLKSDRSKDDGPNFSEKTPSVTKSERWQETLINIGSEITRWKTLKEQRGIKSDEELTTFLLDRIQCETSPAELHTFEDEISRIFQGLENKIAVFFKNELERFKKILKNENTQYYVKDFKENKNNIRETALDVTMHFLRSMKQDELADTLEGKKFLTSLCNILTYTMQNRNELIYTCQLKSDLEKKYQCVFEGIAKQGDSTLLNKIYTDLYITQGGGEQVNTEHEIRQIEVASRNLESPDIQINFKDLFKAHEQTQTIRTVLTKGVAGIGKSVSVQKFVLDWAEGKENQDISFIFPLPFREMNLKEKAEVSLKDLLCEFFPEIKRLDLTRKNKKVLFMLDGLDECRLPLKFDGNEIWSDITSPAPLDVLLTNLIKGNLLPHAHIWITTRPAAAGKIPPECIDQVTEVRGFNDAQKEEYFRKRFTDENMADTIIDHVKKSKSLFIMCHIPVFCWISATVLQNILEKKSKDQTDDTQESNIYDTPRTLTQMYTHFFRFQIQQSRRKYDGEYSPDISWDMDSIYSLGKLAFEQLEKSNLIFYESDLEECGIDVTKASVYSGMCTQIFKQDTGISLCTMYCFVHLSIQEFIAALYAHLFLHKNKKNIFVQEHMEPEAQNETLTGLLKTAVDKALESDNGHLDLFLRFLLGLSLESNRPLLRGLLSQEESNKQNNTEIIQYIKQKFEDSLCPERSINLFYCLNELNDQTLVQEIQKHLSEGSLSSSDLSPAQWSALAFVLLTSDEELEEFELQKFKKSDECLIRLLAVVKSSKHALVSKCEVTEESCSALAAVLSSDSSSLKDLDICRNNLQDDGVKRLSEGLKNTKCELNKLRLRDCGLTEESCSALASVLSSNISVKELDMSNNHLQDSGVKKLQTGLENIHCQLQKLSVSECSIGEEGYKCLYSAVRSNPSHLIELDLRGNDPGETGVKLIYQLIQDHKCKLNTVRFLSSSSAVKAFEYLTETLGINPLLQREVNLSHKLDELRVNQICDLLKDKHCHINTLILRDCGLTEESCSALASVLSSNISVKELDMSNNHLQDSGVKRLSDGLKNNCKLHKLTVSECSIGEEGYKCLYSAVRSNPSHLIELDLRGNDPGETGVKLIYQLIQDYMCSLKTVRFLKSCAAEEACDHLCKALDVNPLLLKELNLSHNKLGDLDGERLSALLMDSHSKVTKIILNDCELTENQCSALAAVLSCKTLVKEMNLSNSPLMDSGLKHICDQLKNPQCQLQILNVSECSIGEEGYKCLYSAVRSNPSHLKELDLRGNDPGETGVKLIYQLIQDHKCKLNTVRFLKSCAAEEACDHLCKALDVNPLLLKELNLSHNKLGDLDGEKLSALLMDSHSKVTKIILNDCELTENQCSALAAVLSCKTLVKEMNLSNSPLMDSGLKHICDQLENPQCQLQILKFLSSSSAVKAFEYLTETLGINPLLQREVNLSDHKLDESRVNQICDLLKDKHCHINTLM